MDILELEKWAFLKYKLNGKKSMNTYIFSQAKKFDLTEREIDKLLKNVDRDIKVYEQEQKLLKEQEEEKMVISEIRRIFENV